MGKTLKYVSEFSFPSDKGYSGSAGKQMVKGYARGGSCGPMKKADGGAVMGASAPQQQPYQQSMGQQPQAQQPSVGAFGFSGFGAAPQQQGGFPAAQEKPMSQQIPGVAPQYKKGGTVKSSKGLAGTRKPMKKADGGRVDDPRRPMIDRTIPELIDAINRERAMEMADRMAAERVMELVRPSRRISQGLRSPRAEMARERAIMGEDAGYKKGGMAMRKQYPTNNGKPMISGPKAAPAPKADMLYSKKEVNAKNLLRDGKAPALPHAKGSVNMKSGGPVKKAMGGAMPPGVSAGAARPGQPQQPLSQQALQMLQGKSPPPGQPQRQMPPLRGPQGQMPEQQRTQGQMPPSGLLQVQGPMRQPQTQGQMPPPGQPQTQGPMRQPQTQGQMPPPGQPQSQGPMRQPQTQGQMPPPGQPQTQGPMRQPQTQGQMPPPGQPQTQGPMRQPMGNVQAPPKGSEAYRMYERAVPLHYRQQIESGQMTQQQMSKIMQSPMMQKRMQYESKYTGPMGPQRPEVQQPNPRSPTRPGPQVKVNPNVRPMPSPNPRSPTRPGPQVKTAPIDTRTTPPQMATYKKGGQTKVGKVMGEFKAGELHSGSKSGPLVKSRKQAIAIGLSEARKAKK
jgi:hypothetical protein